MGLVDAKRVQRLYDRVAGTVSNCAYDDLERLLLAVGFTVRKASGSHRMFKNGSLRITVPPERKPVKAIYVRLALELVDLALKGEPS